MAIWLDNFLKNTDKSTVINWLMNSEYIFKSYFEKNTFQDISLWFNQMES